jgi:nucleotide-binding universal stress UspA family protein
LARWGLMNENDPPAAVAKLGIKVAKIGLKRHEPLRGLVHFLKHRRTDLLVVWTHGRDGIAQWLRGSIAEELSRTAKLPTLFIAPSARGFIDPTNGEFALSQVLVPVDHSPPPASALGYIDDLMSSVSNSAKIELLHVGDNAPLVRNRDGNIVPVATQTGEVVSTILQAADQQRADLLVLATSGHNGFLDAVRGSTSERVLRRALCPVLAIPANYQSENRLHSIGIDNRIAEAFEMLGLEPGATDEEIRSASKRLIQRVHPDKGGTNFLAKQIIDARKLLLEWRENRG